MSACAEVPVVVRAADLPLEVQQARCEQVAELAWANNQTLVIVGETDSKNDDPLLVVCTDVACCAMRPGVLAVVPDVDIVQLGGVPAGAFMHFERRDGRTAHVCPGVA